MSIPVYNKDQEELKTAMAAKEAEGYVCTSGAPRWNEFGQCWIVTMEKPEE
jgi:hypothetical protein